ncbi:MAG: glycosyltransferase family 4 protein [Candidatus Magnetominusculus sp. LBB02]|nr:glycosyltransferase family 4 protein [Candidatus Magnetominusculus sp. LBB02]
MKRVAFIRKTYDRFGGAENYIDSLMSNLKGYEIHMLSARWKETPSAVCHTIESSSLSPALSVIKFNRGAQRLIRRIGPDCTVSFERTTCQDIYRAGDGCHRQWLINRHAGRLRRLSFHFNMLHRTLLSIEKELFQSTPVIVANSNMVKRNIIDHYAVDEDKIHVLYNGVDLARFNDDKRARLSEEFRRRFRVTEDVAIVLFVGSGFERKGLGVLVEAMGRIKSPAVLFVAGRGRTGRYEALAGRLGLSNRIVFAGAAEDIERYYAASDVFVLPTLYDPFSNATLEAMASGAAVITSRNNGAAEIIEDGTDGQLLDDMTDPQELADNIDKAIPICRALGQKAVEKAKAFSIADAARKFKSLIDNYCLNK